MLWHLPNNETPRSKKLRGISTKDISNNNAASSGVFTPRENKIIRNALTPVCFINIRLGIFFTKYHHSLLLVLSLQFHYHNEIFKYSRNIYHYQQFSADAVCFHRETNTLKH